MKLLLCLISCIGLTAAKSVKQTGPMTVIFGGENAEIADAPYMLAMLHYGVYQCGASLISDLYTLSAAHCMDPEFVPAERVSFRGGSNYYREGGVEIKAEKYFVHPKFDKIGYDYDVAVSKLVAPMMGEDIKPIQLSNELFTINNGDIAEVIGWGKTESGYYPDRLMKVLVPVLHHKECTEVYGREIYEYMICAGKKGYDSCNGDSGGPLTYDMDYGNGTYVRIQFGVVSFGPRTCGTHVGVYAKVFYPSIREFIREHAHI